jgi:phosphoribosylglycinamide formyltransferase-1
MPEADPPQRCKIVVLISGNGSNLQAMIDARLTGRLKADIVAVVSNRADAFGLKRAHDASIATHVLDHRGYANRELYDEALLNLVVPYEPDLLVLAGFMRILSEAFVTRFANRIMNIHPSLLPRYPGLNTHQRAMDSDDTVHGCTVHFVTPELDAGPIIIQGQVPILDDDTADSLEQRIHRVEHLIYPMAVEWFATGEIHVESDQVLIDGSRRSPQLIICDKDGKEAG